jgi:hypothetical protein
MCQTGYDNSPTRATTPPTGSKKNSRLLTEKVRKKMKTELRTTFAGELYGVRADWAQAAYPVEFLDGEGNWGSHQYQVADFDHEPVDALRYVIESNIIAKGANPEDYDTAIVNALNMAMCLPWLVI